MFKENDLVVIKRTLIGTMENIKKGTIGKVMNLKLRYTDIKGNEYVPIRFEGEIYSFSWAIRITDIKPVIGDSKYHG